MGQNAQNGPTGPNAGDNHARCKMFIERAAEPVSVECRSVRKNKLSSSSQVVYAAFEACADERKLSVGEEM